MRKQQRIEKFRRDYINADMYLKWKILAGRRAKLSLRNIAEALNVPLTDVVNAWETILQDSR